MGYDGMGYDRIGQGEQDEGRRGILHFITRVQKRRKNGCEPASFKLAS